VEEKRNITDIIKSDFSSKDNYLHDIKDKNSAVINDPLENLIKVKIDQETKNRINQIYNNGKKFGIISDKALLQTLITLYPELMKELDINLKNFSSFIKYIDP